MDRIPKILHMYWDKSPMSKLQVFTIETFHRWNPDWEIKLFVSDNRYKGTTRYVPDYVNKDYFPNVYHLNYVEIIEVDLNTFGVRQDLHDILRSDILRYHLLYNFGGVWSDFDVIWLRPMSHINNIETIGRVSIKEMGSMVTLYDTISGYHNIGILMCTQNHPYYKEAIDRCNQIQETHNEFGHQEFGSEMLNHLFPDLDYITNKYEDVVGFKYETFAPYSIFQMDKLYHDVDLAPLNDNNVIGLHWFNGHQYAKEYVNQNKFGDNSSMTEILKLCGYHA